MKAILSSIIVTGLLIPAMVGVANARNIQASAGQVSRYSPLAESLYVTDACMRNQNYYGKIQNSNCGLAPYGTTVYWNIPLSVDNTGRKTITIYGNMTYWMNQYIGGCRAVAWNPRMTNYWETGWQAWPLGADHMQFDGNAPNGVYVQADGFMYVDCYLDPNGDYIQSVSYNP